MKPSGQGKRWELLQDPTLVASTSLLLCSHRAGKPHGVSLWHGHSSGRAVTGWLWGQEGTFLCSDSFGHMGGHWALRRGASRCWGWAPKGGTPAVHPAAPPPCGSPGSELGFISVCFPPPSLRPLPSPPRCQVRRFPAVTLSSFLELVVGFLKEPCGQRGPKKSPPDVPTLTGSPQGWGAPGREHGGP